MHKVCIKTIKLIQLYKYLTKLSLSFNKRQVISYSIILKTLFKLLPEVLIFEIYQFKLLSFVFLK